MTNENFNSSENPTVRKVNKTEIIGDKNNYKVKTSFKTHSHTHIYDEMTLHTYMKAHTYRCEHILGKHTHTYNPLIFRSYTDIQRGREYASAL